MLQPTSLQKLLSWFYPVRIKRLSSPIHPILEIFFFRNEFQLATEDAVYSDGSRYRPLLEAFNKVEQSLDNHANMLVLGAGLGSAISILKKKGYCMAMTLVDNDEEIIKLNKEWRWKDSTKATFFHEDARFFIENTHHQFNILVVDVFKDRVVPEFVTEKDFLKACHEKTVSGGKIILNYILNNEIEWKKMHSNFVALFPKHEIISFGINRVMIATV